MLRNNADARRCLYFELGPTCGAPDKIMKNIFVLDCFDEQAKRVLAKVAL